MILAEGWQKVVDETDSTARTGAFSKDYSFTAGGVVDALRVTLKITLAETGTAQAIADTGPLNSMKDLTLKVGGTAKYTLPVAQEADYATGHGILGEINRLVFGFSIYQEGDGAVAASGSEARNVTFLLPVFDPKSGGKTVGLNINFRAVADWTSGAGTPSHYATQAIIEAHYVDSTTEAVYQVVDKDSIGASLADKQIALDDKKGYFIQFAIGSLVQSSAYEHHITRVKVQDQGGVCHQDMDYMGMIHNACARGGLITQYASTKTFAERNEGVFGVPVDGSEMVAQKILISTNASAASATVTFWVMATSEASGVNVSPRRQSQHSGVDSTGADQKPGGTKK